MDKYIFITNANSKVGNELAKKFISENYIVFAGDISYENKKFGNLIYINLDPNSYKSLEAAKRYVLKYTSQITAIISLANHYSFSSLLECKEEDMHKAIEENFFCAFKTNQVLWNILDQRIGKIIHDCSDVSLYELMPFNGLYSLSKTLLKNYNDILRRELKEKGIAVVRVHTGFVKDDNYEKLLSEYHRAADESKLMFSEMNRFITLNIPNEGFITPIEYSEFIARVVKFRIPKKAYYFKCSKKLKNITNMPTIIREIYLKNYQK